MPFLERAAIADMARGLAGGDTRIATQLFAYGDHWLAAAAVTGRTIGVLNTGTARDGANLRRPARLHRPSRRHADQGIGLLVHVGVHGSYVVHPKNAKGPDNYGNLSAAIIQSPSPTRRSCAPTVRL